MGVDRAKGPPQRPLCAQKGLQEGPVGGLIAGQTHPFPGCSDEQQGGRQVWGIPHPPRPSQRKRWNCLTWPSPSPSKRQDLDLLPVVDGGEGVRRGGGIPSIRRNPVLGFDSQQRTPAGIRDICPAWIPGSCGPFWVLFWDSVIQCRILFQSAEI